MQIPGDDDPNKEEREKQIKIQNLNRVSLDNKAFQMFEDGRPLAKVAVDLDLKTDTVIDFYGRDYLRLDR
ncbi:MAG: hypothetical protein ABJB76_03945 [Candidatus Nitrosocosmicus sp.]